MKQSSRLVSFFCAVFLSLLLTQCQDAQQTGAVGMGLSAVGQMIGGDAGRMLNVVGNVMVYTATQRQIAQAQATANEALRRSSVRQAVKRSNARYVVVPVKRDRETQKNGKSSNMVMLVDSETGKPKGRAFEPTQKSYRSGDEVKVGSTKAVVATSFSGI